MRPDPDMPVQRTPGAGPYRVEVEGSPAALEAVTSGAAEAGWRVRSTSQGAGSEATHAVLDDLRPSGPRTPASS